MARNQYSKKKGSAVTSTGTRLRVLEGSGKKAAAAREHGKNGSLAELEERIRRRRARTWLAVFLFVLAAASVIGWALDHYRVETIYVEGNVHYTSDEIIELVTSEPLGDNSLYLTLKYRSKGIEGVPFIENMDVKVLDPNTVKIVVYEKSVAGFVEYLGGFMYFDNEGVVVEASEARTLGIPEITGISFEYVVLHEPLPVDNPEVFRSILDMTQMLGKYGLIADQMYFDDSGEITLFFGKTRAKLGDDDNMEEKISRLKQILPAAEGQSGVFRLENYAGSGSNVSFERDDL